jgi:hypothetical protein
MFLKMGQFILVSGALMGKMMPPATNQTWLAGKSPTKMEQYTGEIIQLNGWFSHHV